MLIMQSRMQNERAVIGRCSTRTITAPICLPVELQRHLHIPSRGCLIDRSERRISQVFVRRKEGGMVQRIEHFRARLQTLFFADVYPLLKSQGPADIVRGAQVGEGS